MRTTRYLAPFLAIAALLRFGTAFGVGLDPTVGHGLPALDFWQFSDTNWISHYGNAPMSATNLVNVPYLGDGNCLLLDSVEPAWLQYSTSYHGTNRLTVDRGSIILWFASSWSGTNVGGTGPGSWGRLIEVGSFTEDASYGWWSLYLRPAGDRIYFASQTNGAGATYISAPVSLETNWWHMIALTYGADTNTCLYWDGLLLTNGPPLAYWPSPEVLSNGVFIGSDSGTGLAQARGMFEDLSTYAEPLDADSIASGYFSGWMFYMNPFNKANYCSSAPSQPSWTPSFNAITGPGYLVAVSNVLSGCVSNSSIWITNGVATSATNGTKNLYFSIGGGQDGVYYDVFANSVLSRASSTNAWAWMGQGLHCVTYLLTNLPSTSAFLILGKPTDSDADGLTDAYEGLVSKTDPLNADSDGDGLLDGEEVGIYHLDPKKQDSDGDGVMDEPFKVIIGRPSRGGGL